MFFYNGGNPERRALTLEAFCSIEGESILLWFYSCAHPCLRWTLDFIEMAGILGGCGPPNNSYKIRDTWVPIKSPRGFFFIIMCLSCASQMPSKLPHVNWIVTCQSNVTQMSISLQNANQIVQCQSIVNQVSNVNQMPIKCPSKLCRCYLQIQFYTYMFIIIVCQHFWKPLSLKW